MQALKVITTLQETTRNDVLGLNVKQASGEAHVRGSHKGTNLKGQPKQKILNTRLLFVSRFMGGCKSCKSQDAGVSPRISEMMLQCGAVKSLEQSPGKCYPKNDRWRV